MPPPKLPSLPPRCISALGHKRVQPRTAGIPKGWNYTSFAVRCPCGHKRVRLLGYRLAEKNKSDFIGPLAILCPSCAMTHELMDPDKDGHDGEIGDNCVSRGTGPRIEWRCSRCRLTEGKIFASFGYQFEPGNLAARFQDFFDAFILTHHCPKRKRPVRITVFECA
jgi:hypothetical protein